MAGASRLVLGLMLLLLAACGQAPRTTTEPSPNLVFDPAQVARANHLVIAVPGALTSIAIFEPIEPRLDQRTAAVFYKLPGMDGRPTAPRITMAGAGAEIARFAAMYPDKRITLVGVSAGAAISLEAAWRIGPRASVAAISTPAPGEINRAGVRAVDSAARIASRLGTVQRKAVWNAYYKVLLYGEGYRDSPETRARAEAVLQANLEDITLPTPGLFFAQGGDLLTWEFSDRDKLVGNRVVFFHGTVDPVFPIAPLTRFAATLPDAYLDPIDGHGHLLFASDPAFFQRVGKIMGAW